MSEGGWHNGEKGKVNALRVGVAILQRMVRITFSDQEKTER